MNRIFALFLSFWRTALRSLAIPCVLAFTLLCSYLAVRNSGQKPLGFITQPGAILPYVLGPVVLAGGLLTKDARTRRIVIWLSCGLTRKEFVIAKFAFLFSELALLVAIPYVSGYSIAIGSISSASILWVLLAVMLGMLQLAAQLTCLSALFPGNWNAILSFAAFIAFVLLYINYADRINGLFSQQEVQILRASIISPYVLLKSALKENHAFYREALSSVCTTITYLLVALAVFPKKQLATQFVQD